MICHVQGPVPFPMAPLSLEDCTALPFISLSHDKGTDDERRKCEGTLQDFFFFFFRATPRHMKVPRARGQIGAAASNHSHSNVGSKLHL